MHGSPRSMRIRWGNFRSVVYVRLVVIHKEKQLKKWWHRDWKEKIISDFNPECRDLREHIGVDEEYIHAV